MRLRGTPLPLVTGAEIDLLVADQVNEDVRLDFKATLYKERGGATAVTPEKAAIALCKDVTSLANARGGVIVCGVAATSGIASKVVGVPHAMVDAEKLWMDSIITQRVQPNIPGLQVREVTTAAGAVVVLIGVPASLARPHAFIPTPSESPQWWRRGLAGNVPMDVAELRTLFLEMGTWERDAAAWREERFRRLREGIGVLPLPARPTVVVHMQPLGGPRDPIIQAPGVPGAHPTWLANFFPPDLFGGIETRINIDGWQLTHRVHDMVAQHAQVFRATGAVEVRLDTGNRLIDGKNQWNGDRLRGAALEHLLARTVKSMFVWAELMDLEGPFMVSVRLFGVERATLTAAGTDSPLVGEYTIDMPTIDLPHLLVDSPPSDVVVALRLMRDALWQAAGWTESPVRERDGTPSYAAHVNALRWDHF